jgi:hypothetical protein
MAQGLYDRLTTIEHKLGIDPNEGDRDREIINVLNRLERRIERLEGKIDGDNAKQGLSTANYAEAEAPMPHTRIRN